MFFENVPIFDDIFAQHRGLESAINAGEPAAANLRTEAATEARAASAP